MAVDRPHGADLLGLLVASVWTGRAVASLGAESAVTINLTGHQWWWEAEYEDATAERSVSSTANELHIPVGRPVVLKVTSHDVIHSIWMPNLHGKRDLIPGYTTAIWLQADKPGLYRGQCAEFCGLQHARMALYVTAESNSDFEKWRDEPAACSTQLRPPTSERRGRDVFLHCHVHAVPHHPRHDCRRDRGTGPDAPRVARHASPRGRCRTGAAIWPVGCSTRRASSRAPACPRTACPSGDLQVLLAYLESLK